MTRSKNKKSCPPTSASDSSTTLVAGSAVRTAIKDAPMRVAASDSVGWTPHRKESERVPPPVEKEPSSASRASSHFEMDRGAWMTAVGTTQLSTSSELGASHGWSVEMVELAFAHRSPSTVSHPDAPRGQSMRSRIPRVSPGSSVEYVDSCAVRVTSSSQSHIAADGLLPRTRTTVGGVSSSAQSKRPLKPARLVGCASKWK